MTMKDSLVVITGALPSLDDDVVTDCLALEAATRRVPGNLVYQSPSDVNVLEKLPWQVFQLGA